MYERQLSTRQPGCVAFLLDQSESMTAYIQGESVGPGNRKTEFVARVVDRALDDLIRMCTMGRRIVNRLDVAVVGYGGRGAYSALPEPLNQQDFASLEELQEHPRSIEERMEKSMDETGTIVDYVVQYPRWVAPLADGATPMSAAIASLRGSLERWTTTHQESFPPVVVHVTDGMPNDANPAAEFERLRALATIDGGLLLFTCHLSSQETVPIVFPNDPAVLPNDEYAHILFAATSEIPDVASYAFRMTFDQPMMPGTRGYTFNGDADSTLKMFQFASGLWRRYHPLPAPISADY